MSAIIEIVCPYPPSDHQWLDRVCTHPDFQGRGLGTLLFRFVAGEIAARGETAYLHAYTTNAPAIALYEAMGFRLRSEMNLCVVKRRAV